MVKKKISKKNNKKRKNKINIFDIILDFKKENKKLYDLIIAFFSIIITLISLLRMGIIGQIIDNVLKYLIGSTVYIIYIMLFIFLILLILNIKLKGKIHLFLFIILTCILFQLIYMKTSNYNLLNYNLVKENYNSFLGGGVISYYPVMMLSNLLSFYGTIIIIISSILVDIILYVNILYPDKVTLFIEKLLINKSNKNREKNDEIIDVVNNDTVNNKDNKYKKNKHIENSIDDLEISMNENSIYNEKKSPNKLATNYDNLDLHHNDTDYLDSNKDKNNNSYINYKFPPISLLNDATDTNVVSKDEILKKSKILKKTLENFGVNIKIVKAVVGPTITQFQILPNPGTKVSKIINLSNDIALNLAAKDVRIEAPIPGKSLIGVEIPNEKTKIVTLKEIILKNTDTSPLSVSLGKNVSGDPIFARLDKMPHLLVAGSTGSGKSVCINTIISSILMKNKPDQVKLILIDPKMVELSIYDGIPHLMTPVVTNPVKAAEVLFKVVLEMERRYKEFSIARVRNIDSYNKIALEDNEYKKLPYIVVIIDELADLMMVASKEVEESIVRITQMARAAGIHLIIATQRPSVDVITGVIKSNIPSRIAFSVSSNVDSRTILDKSGAEMLLGKGDMLFQSSDSIKAQRVQGAYLSDQEVEKIVGFIKNQYIAEYDPNMSISESKNKENVATDTDPIYQEVLQFIAKTQKASASLLQRRFKIGYNRAARIIDYLEEDGYIGPSEGNKPRKVFLEPEFLENNN